MCSPKEKILFNDKLRELHDVVVNIISEKPIIYELDDSEELRKTRGVYDSIHSLVKISPWFIEESVVSHELLHAYFHRNNYNRIKIANDELIHRFCKHIFNSIEHKLIYAYQDKYGFDREQESIYYATTLINKIEQDSELAIDNLQYALNVFEAEIRCNKYRDLYIGRLQKYFPKTLEIAQRLLTVANEYDYQTPFETRRAFVMTIREIDNIIKESGEVMLYLNSSCMIPFIPSLNELNLKMNQLFTFEYKHFGENNEECFIISKDDNQLCYSIGIDSFYDFYMSNYDLTLTQFYEKYEIGYSLRS